MDAVPISLHCLMLLSFLIGLVSIDGNEFTSSHSSADSICDRWSLKVSVVLTTCSSEIVFADHYKAASTRSHKQINCVYRWKFEGKYPKLGAIITYNAAGAFWKIVYPSFILPIKKILAFLFPTQSVSFLFFEDGLQKQFSSLICKLHNCLWI